MTRVRRSPLSPPVAATRSSASASSGRRQGGGLASSIALLQLAIAAGLAPRNALVVLSEELRGAAAIPFVAIAERLAIGAPMHDALFHDIELLDPALIRVLQVIERADVDGLDAGPHLDAIAADVSSEQIAALDIASHRLSVQLLFPLVFCILPAFLCLSMIPLVLDVFDGLPR
jgi:tight adherence protein C